MAQNRQASRERIETAKIGFITNRLNLTSEQASTFWPVYNAYEDKKQQIRQSLRKLKSANTALTAPDDALMNNLKELMSLKQQEVDLEKEYLTKFLKVINPRQLTELYKTEQDFREELLKTLRERRTSPRNPN
ncbi:MAG: hypothetical protein H7Z75_05955 [Ferruginibacter sp.]|nr:hypothetical protein [Cytophagales bacterium]